MLPSLCAENVSEILVATPDLRRKELIPDYIESETDDSDFEDKAELPFNCTAATKLHKTSKVLRSDSKYRIVRINTKPIVGGPLPTVMKTRDTYTMPSYYYSLPKHEWKEFYFLQPIKSSLKPIVNPLQNPSLRKRRIVHLSQPRRLPAIPKLSRLLSKPLREPPTWPEIIGAQFPIDPPMSRLMFTRSPTTLLTPLSVDTSPKSLSPTKAQTSLEDHQVIIKHKEKCKSKLQLPLKSQTKSTKRSSKELGDPMKMKKYIKIQFDDNTLPIIYHKNYNLKVLPYSMDRFQPMIPDKPEKVYSLLKNGCLEEYDDVNWTGVDISIVYNIDDYEPEFIKEMDIKWIAHVMQLRMLMSVVSLDQFDFAILRPLRVQMMGSVLACQIAMEEGWAINVGGGFAHYATNISSAGGLAVYDDILVCLAIMSRSPQVEKILVIDIDAYQHLSYEDESRRSIRCPVTIIDIYSRENQQQIYKTRETKTSALVYPVSPVNYIGCKLWTNNCITRLCQEIDRLFKDSASSLPSLCIYVAGTNSLQENHCTPFFLTSQEVVKRDEEVFELIHKTYGIPMAMLLGGGYHPCDVEVAAASISNLCQIAAPCTSVINQESPVHSQKLNCKVASE